MNRNSAWLYNFMRGRYGFDQLGQALSVGVVVMWIFSILCGVLANMLRMVWLAWLSTILNWVGLIRSFSWSFACSRVTMMRVVPRTRPSCGVAANVLSASVHRRETSRRKRGPRPRAQRLQIPELFVLRSADARAGGQGKDSREMPLVWRKDHRAKLGKTHGELRQLPGDSANGQDAGLFRSRA